MSTPKSRMGRICLPWTRPIKLRIVEKEGHSHVQLLCEALGHINKIVTMMFIVLECNNVFVHMHVLWLLGSLKMCFNFSATMLVGKY